MVFYEYRSVYIHHSTSGRAPTRRECEKESARKIKIKGRRQKDKGKGQEAER